MQTINDKHNWFLIYHDIIQSSLFHAKRFERWEQRPDISKEYLKVIDELIQCINEKHEKDFFFDRIRNGNETSSLTASVMGMSTYSAQYSLQKKRTIKTECGK